MGLGLGSGPVRKFPIRNRDEVAVSMAIHSADPLHTDLLRLGLALGLWLWLVVVRVRVSVRVRV